MARVCNNGESLAWETARTIWLTTTSRNRPDIWTGMIRGIYAGPNFENNHRKDSEKLSILISMMIWSIRAIRASRNKNSINSQDAVRA